MVWLQKAVYLHPSLQSQCVLLAELKYDWLIGTWYAHIPLISHDQPVNKCQTHLKLWCIYIFLLFLYSCCKATLPWQWLLENQKWKVFILDLICSQELLHLTHLFQPAVTSDSRWTVSRLFSGAYQVWLWLPLFYDSLPQPASVWCCHWLSLKKMYFVKRSDNRYLGQDQDQVCMLEIYS